MESHTETARDESYSQASNNYEENKTDYLTQSELNQTPVDSPPEAQPGDSPQGLGLSEAPVYTPRKQSMYELAMKGLSAMGGTGSLDHIAARLSDIPDTDTIDSASVTSSEDFWDQTMSPEFPSFGDPFAGFMDDFHLDKASRSIPGGNLERLRRKTDEIKTQARIMRTKVEKRMKSAPFVRTRDKVTFTLGMFNLVANSYLLGAFPLDYWMLHALQFVTLLAVRFYTYHKMSAHYYLFDFCYYVNVLLIAYSYVLWSHPRLFQALFAFTVGPLSWSIGLFRNSMVLHSVDKMTSVFIHLAPALSVWSLRWHHGPNGENGKFAICSNDECRWDWGGVLSSTVLLYSVWVGAYYYRVFVWGRSKVERKERETLFDLVWKNMPYFRSYLMMFGDYHKYKMYMTLHIALTLVTCTLAGFMWQSFVLHTSFLAFVLMWSMWNGANFYMEFFSRKYEQQLAKITAIEQGVSDNEKSDAPQTDDNSSQPATKTATEKKDD
eukprot:Clim_evm109s134 gene=Clim_evmTU109s134